MFANIILEKNVYFVTTVHSTSASLCEPSALHRALQKNGLPVIKEMHPLGSVFVRKGPMQKGTLQALALHEFSMIHIRKTLNL